MGNEQFHQCLQQMQKGFARLPPRGHPLIRERRRRGREKMREFPQAAQTYC